MGLKEILGEELYGKVTEALKGKGKDGKDVEIAIRGEEKNNGNDNSYRIKVLEDEIKALKDGEATLKVTHEQERAADKLNFEIEKALGGAKLKGSKTVDIVKNLLDKGKIKFEDGKLQGVTEQLEELKKTDAHLFEAEDTTVKFKGIKIADGVVTEIGDADVNAWRKEAGLEE